MKFFSKKMKNKLIIILAICGFYTCKAQSPILDLHDNDLYFGDVNNAYYKDIEGFYNQFVGTWVYTSGNTMLKVKFKKKDMFYQTPPPVAFYIDYLIGEFQYIENGVEKANTLSNLDINHTDISDYNIVSLGKVDLTGFPKCNDCPAGTVRISMMFDEPANDDVTLLGAFVMRKVVENGVEKIKVQFQMLELANNVNKANWDLPSTARKHTIPYGDYTLVKVEE